MQCPLPCFWRLEEEGDPQAPSASMQRFWNAFVFSILPL